MSCETCAVECERPRHQNEYIVHRCGAGEQWCKHLGKHLPPASEVWRRSRR